MKLSELEILIDKYLEGKASEEEKERVERWLDHPTAPMAELTPAKKEALTRYFWDNILAGIGMAPARPRRRIVHLFHQAKSNILRIAAALLLMIMAATIIKYTIIDKWMATPAYTVITAKEGQALHYVLPDGSTASLFPGSAIQVPDHYNQSDRQVKVHGRVFFEIARSESNPFYVVAGELQTRVLGTSFEVNTLAALQPTVVVKTGKVAVSYKGQQQAVLTVNKRLRINLSDPHPAGHVDSVNAASICSWWKGTFDFEQTTLPEVLQTISQWYKIPIAIQGEKWYAERVTMHVETGLPVEAVMQLLAETLGNHYKMTGQHITIY
ncbi:FecR family protein [Chitinophaga nivalis]|uniref:FecR domain-containing protein n=1 Tax=Chitinophaga nivalis TaxID=2991709 RepID=A0ABT3IJW4_9BACT|nr:FecR domain-containing protein [Chitinophaga nivalis]MCW3466075.1 FecR domain-containing protein [Chitinophaga nivalis]MCW3484234.1 FecR domain-containing protein [Chitinophaga nivalis]